MAASPFCTPCSSPPSSPPSPSNPASLSSSAITPFSSSIPLRQKSVERSFVGALCSDPSFAHFRGNRANAFCHPLPESFADFADGSLAENGAVEAKIPTRYNDMPCIFLTNEELDILDQPLALTLIAKFPAGRPKWASLNNYFRELKMLGEIKLNHYDSRHVVIHFAHPDDYAKVFAKPVTTILSFAVKFLKWTRNFDIHQEPVITPIWISLPNLCMNFFTRNMLLSIASAFGKPLIIDSATANGLRPINARILVEMNVLKQHPKSIWLGNDEFGYSQAVVIENLPKYCEHCCKYGHIVEQCYIKDPKLKKVKEDGNVKGQEKRNKKDLTAEDNSASNSPLDVNAQTLSKLNTAADGAADEVAANSPVENASNSPLDENAQTLSKLNTAAAGAADEVGANSPVENIQLIPTSSSEVDASQDCVMVNILGTENSEQSCSSSHDLEVYHNLQVLTKDPIPKSSTHNGCLLNILKASSSADLALLGSAISKINWESLNLEDTADQIIDMATTKLIEECYQVVFEGSQSDGVASKGLMVDSNATTQNFNDEVMSRIMFSPINVMRQGAGLEELESGSLDDGISVVALKDQVWMGLSNDKSNDDEAIKYGPSTKPICSPQVACRRHSWSNEMEQVDAEAKLPRKYKKKVKPQIQIEKGSCRNTRSSKKDAFYYLQ